MYDMKKKYTVLILISFAMGVTGGLLSSVFAIVFIMPLFVKFGNRQRCKCADTR